MSMTDNGITVLMAVYQGRKYLEQQLDSILAQTIPVQILVSDDGSDDGSRELLEQYRKRYPEQIRLCHRTRKQGQCKDETGEKEEIPPAARNFFWLMETAARENRKGNPQTKKVEHRHEYIMLSDQDDVWFSHKAEALFAEIRSLEGIYGKGCPLLVYSDMEVTDADLKPIHASFLAYQHSDPKRTSLAQVLVENPVTGGALMMNEALLKLTAQKPESCCMHDWWIALTAACFGRISCVQQPLYQYRQHGGNTLGAKATGSVEDLKARLSRQRQVKENYRRMWRQGRAFAARHGRRMQPEQKKVLTVFLALPGQRPLMRLSMVRKYGFYKSSAIQTLAMCMTMPPHRR